VRAGVAQMRTRPSLKQCNDYVFAVPILLTNVAIPEPADRDYGRRPH
jgi:hypothetical protein